MGFKAFGNNVTQNNDHSSLNTFFGHDPIYTIDSAGSLSEDYISEISVWRDGQTMSWLVEATENIPRHEAKDDTICWFTTRESAEMYREINLKDELETNIKDLSIAIKVHMGLAKGILDKLQMLSDKYEKRFNQPVSKNLLPHTRVN